MTDTFSAFIQFNKVEENPDGSLLVWGRATQEVGDSQGEIMDYQTSAPQFRRRANEVSKNTSGVKVMPLRSMHQPVAAGNVVQFDFQDKERAIDICANVIDTNEIEKVRKGVYTGFSVGGKYLKRWPDGNLVRFTADPHEISLVDVPAVPTARFTMFKVDGIEKGGQGSGNHGHKGRPGQRGGSGPGGEPADMQHLIDDLFVDGQKENGFSYNPFYETSPQDGFMCSMYPERLKEIKTSDMNALDLAEYANANSDLLADPENYLGAWAEKTGDTCLDISRKFASRDEAFQMGIDKRQAGIFDVTTKNTIYIHPKFDPDSGVYDKKIRDDFVYGRINLEDVGKAHAEMEMVKNLKVIGDRVGIAWRNGSPSTPPTDYPVNSFDYGDPANFDFPVDPIHWAESAARFNKGNTGEYSPREWHVLGRRITLSGRGLGATYDPEMKKINRKEEKPMSQTDLSKLDVGKLLETLKAAASTALTNSSDQVSKDALTQILGQLDDLSTPIGKSVPAIKDPGMALKADAPAAGEDHKEPDGDESKESKIPAEFAEKMSGIEKSIAGLSEVVAKFAEAMNNNATVAKSGNGPLNGLNALLNAAPQGDPAVDNEIIKALEEGGPYAMAKALKAAAGDDEFANGAMAYERVYNAIRQASYSTLEKGGVITQNRHIQKLYSPDGPIFS